MKEKDLLTNFLVGNELHDVVTLNQFIQFFPSQYRSHPEVKDLYRTYLNARHQTRTKVRKNIDIEVRRNPLLLDSNSGHDVDTSKTLRLHDNGDIDRGISTDDDVDIEDVDKHLTLDQAIQELIQAEKIYKREITQLEQECNDFAEEFQKLDREMEGVQVPGHHLNSLREESLMKDIQKLIQLCDSITDKIPTDSSMD
ncbi:hypothetical protein BCR41DRAFT_346933 [Lobosporangium transversale]|uniref:Uncharacterized protein n=1 Tax=Lobosporangium transversale TaxID=64571 RepID=A0A1Y2GZ30_9FUNG|nr:hypothetical protein BCR41DRAFT_346933 [Lobosporangium transversale]ORZ27525.1 hypothetical protein BCR41DRAFT_346933 [Lobosporangium transversale]|eukprot:XP_021885252.1 hypothetical protein BCR41DRAFT_346933 [Lobosporangium transversale]